MKAIDQSDCRDLEIFDDFFDGNLHLLQLSLLFLSGSGAKVEGVRQTEPLYVPHPFSGLPGACLKGRRPGKADGTVGVLWGAGHLFSLLHFPISADLPKRVQTAVK